MTKKALACGSAIADPIRLPGTGHISLHLGIMIRIAWSRKQRLLLRVTSGSSTRTVGEAPFVEVVSKVVGVGS